MTDTITLNRNTANQLRDRLLEALSNVWFQVEDDSVIHDPNAIERLEPEDSFVDGEAIYLGETEKEQNVLMHLHHEGGTGALKKETGSRWKMTE